MPKFLIAIFLLAGVALISYTFLNPAWQEFKLLQQGNTELQQESAEFDFLVQRRDALIQEINAISKAERDTIDKAIPVGAKAAEFMVDLEAITKKRGLALKRIDLAGTIEVQAKGNTPGQPITSRTPTTAPDQEAILEFPIGLSVSGSYESFKGFLQDLEKNLRIIDVQDIAFISPPKGEIFDFTLRIKTYFQ